MRAEFADPNLLYYRPLNLFIKHKMMSILTNFNLKVIGYQLSMFWHSYFFVLPRYFNIIDPSFILTEV